MITRRILEAGSANAIARAVPRDDCGGRRGSGPEAGFHGCGSQPGTLTARPATVSAGLRIRLGQADSLGASWHGSETNFVLSSAHGEKVELCLLDAAGRTETVPTAPPKYLHEIGHA